MQPFPLVFFPSSFLQKKFYFFSLLPIFGLICLALEITLARNLALDKCLKCSTYRHSHLSDRFHSCHLINRKCDDFFKGAKCP